MLPSYFVGTNYRLPNNWFCMIDANDFNEKPIKYLEIGTFYGANLLCVENTYAINPQSQLYCIDPWLDYDDYPEYKNMQTNIYHSFLKNIENCPNKYKITVKRGFSHIEVLKFENDFFDIIYIDGNHEPHCVIEDAVLSFRKLKKNGFMIFDDYHDDTIKNSIDNFAKSYYKKIKILGHNNGQFFVQKTHVM